MKKYIENILNARVYDVAVETPLELADSLSKRLNNQCWLKREDKQPVFSFKCRGAYNRIYNLTQQQKIEGVVTASAGNHAQGVALSAKKLGLKSIIVMPRTTPSIKVKAVDALGGVSILHGDNYDAAYTHALEIAKEKNYPFIHAFDSADTIAGQGTVGMEICRQHADPIHTIFVPIGGGGLASGIAVYLKYLRPDVKIIGVEPIDSAAMHDSLKAGKRIVLDHVGMFADGVAVRQVGEETFRLCQKYLDGVVLVSVDEISAAVKDIFDESRTMMEPSGALAVAGLKKYVTENQISGQNLIAVTSGANVNFDRLRHIAERAEVGEQREALLAVTLKEQPGSFRKFCSMLGDRSITEWNYRYAGKDRARVFVGIELSNGIAERHQIIENLRQAEYPVEDLTDNEVAKLHVRYMVGGHADQLENELLLRVEFPERPGALMQFLTNMGEDWNISLFHYRNHGSAFGRVLVGMQVPEQEQVPKFLEELGYVFVDETDNPAYKAFLQ